jgi:thiamine biosynthesis lipoprotein
MRLDAGGVGKGYAAAEGLVVLREAGFGAALVGLAGDIAVGLPPPGREGGVGVGGGGWLVAISTDAGEPTGRVLELREASVSTSGAAVQVARAGEWGGPEGAFGRGHVVDPRSGVWLSPGGAMTVVVRWGADPARAGALADALATAALVLGEEGARRAVGGFAGAELVVTPGREGRWRE